MKSGSRWKGTVDIGRGHDRDEAVEDVSGGI